jgi:hypothetical protein
VAADHHDDGGGVELAQAFQRLDAVDPRHLHIHEDQVRLPLPVLRDAVGGAADAAHLVTLVLEQLAERRADSLLVIDDEDASAHCGLR